MTGQDVDDGDSGATIELSIPLRNPDLFRYSATSDLLGFLIEHPYESFTIRKLARVTDNAPQSVKRAADVLAENGLLRIDTKGNRRLVSIDRSRLSKPDDPVLVVPQSEYHKPLREAVDRIRDGLTGVLGILVFGSVARGDADRQSDIDLWVLAERNQQHEANQLAKRLGTERFDGDRYEFQILLETPTSAADREPDLVDVFSEGIRLYSRPQLESLEREVLDRA